MVAYITPTFTYPTVAAGKWALLFGGDSVADTGSTYASSGFMQWDATKWASTVTAVDPSTPATGKVRYTIGSHAYAVGDSVSIGAVTGGSPANGYVGNFTVTDITATAIAVSNSTTGTAGVTTASVAGATWAPVGNLLNPVPTSDILSIDVHRGRSREDQAVDVGTMTVVLDNTSGDYDPDNNTGPWRFPTFPSGTSTSLTRGMWAQLVFHDGTALRKVFTGYLEAIEADPDIFPTATLTFVDVLAIVAQAEVLDGVLRGVQGETSKARITRILQAGNVALPTVDKDGVQTYQQLSLGTLNRTHEAADLSGGCLELIEGIAGSEGGRVYCTTDGTFRVVSHADLPTSGSTAAYTLTDAGTGGFEYISIQTTPMHKQVTNTAVVTTPSGAQATSRVLASQARYGVISTSITTTLSDNSSTTPSSSLQGFADFLASRRAQPSTAFSAVQFELRGLSNANIGTVVKTDVSAKVTLRRKTPAGLTVTAGCWIEGIDFSLTPDSWTWVLYTSAVDNPASTY